MQVEEEELGHQQEQVELVEDAFQDTSAAFDHFLNALVSRGVLIAIDDFGTGYSSLARLISLPINGVKVDRMFVDRIGSDDDSPRLLLRTMLTMLNDLGMAVTAEGIEQRDQQQATGSGANEVEEVDTLDALDGFRDEQGDDGAGEQEGKCREEVDDDQFEVAGRALAREQEDQRGDDRDAVESGKMAELLVESTLPAIDDVREDTAGAEAEQGDRDREEGEVVVEDDALDAGERELQQQRGHRGQGHAGIDRGPIGGARRGGGSRNSCQLYIIAVGGAGSSGRPAALRGIRIMIRPRMAMMTRPRAKLGSVVNSHILISCQAK
jgi:hypothetical protein